MCLKAHFILSNLYYQETNSGSTIIFVKNARDNLCFDIGWLVLQQKSVKKRSKLYYLKRVGGTLHFIVSSIMDSNSLFFANTIRGPPHPNLIGFCLPVNKVKELGITPNIQLYIQP